MARYIDDILQGGEQVLYSTNAHWIVYWKSILCWILTAAVLILMSQARLISTGLGFLVITGTLSLLAFALMLMAWFHRWTTETDVTNFRVVHKTGFITRKTFEMALDKVESVDVNQSLMGRLLNYGDVTILGVGEGRKTIETIASPLAFRNSITVR